MMEKLELKYGLGVKFSINLPEQFKAAENVGYEILEGKDCVKKLKENLEQEVVKKYLDKIIKQDENEFTKQNSQYWTDGLLITIPQSKTKKIVVEQKVHGDCFSKIFIHALPHSQAEIIFKISGTGFRSEMIEAIAEENSKLKIAIMQNLDENTVNINLARAIVKNNASVNWFQAGFGSSFSELGDVSYLDGEGASSNHFGIFYGKNTQQMDVYSANFHNSKSTNSDIFVRSVLDNKSKAMLRGLVRIDSNAPQSSGYQKEDVLLLSEDAEGDSIPQLDINNHDVRCTHGATIGTVDKQQLFYLMSKGMPKELAARMIVGGFFYPVMQRAQFSINEELQQLIESKL